MPRVPVGLLTSSAAYKPFRYPWAFQAWRRQKQIHWLPEEVQMGEDIKDWTAKLNDGERDFLTKIFRFFTQADLDVAGGYFNHFIPFFKAHDVRMMLAAFGAMETVHMEAYAQLISTLGMPDSEFAEFTRYGEMVAKHEFLSGFDMGSDENALRSIAAFSAFTEGLQLFASFAMLMNFPRWGLMKGMGQIIAWSVRDESLHCEGMIRLFHAFAEETGALSRGLKSEIRDIGREAAELEFRFIDLVFEGWLQRGITADDMRAYARHIADWRLRQLRLEPVFGEDEYPLPWLRNLLHGVEHANFFETRATEYSSGATTSTWPLAWKGFDERMAARGG